MKEALSLLGELSSADAEWFCSQAHERRVTADTCLLNEGETPEALFFILEGLVRVHVSGLKSRPLAALGPGELLGEISFLENRPATASVVAAEDSLVLAIPRTLLQQRIQEDPAFAVRLYRSFALTAARRLENRVGALNYLLQNQQQLADAEAASWRDLSHRLEAFKERLHRVDRETLRNRGQMPPEPLAEAERSFADLLEAMHARLGDGSPEPKAVRDDLGAKVQRELLPYLLLSESAERFYAKPRGYAGDFHSIDLVYRDQPSGVGRIGPAVDRCFLNSSVCQIIRRRRQLLWEAIAERIQSNRGALTRIVSLACGPAAEVFDAYSQLQNPTQVQTTLVEIDAQALTALGERRQKLGLQEQIQLVPGNLVYLALGRQKLDVQDQDLIYSGGLIGSLDDKTVVRLLDYIHQLLRPGGKVLLGSFDPRDPAKPFLDYVLDWRFVHRGEDDLNRLFFDSAFARPCTAIHSDPPGLHLLAECVKE